MPRVIYGSVAAARVPELVKAAKEGKIMKEMALCASAQDQFLNGKIVEYSDTASSIDCAEFPPFKGQVRIAMRNAGSIDPMDIEEYAATGGFAALARRFSREGPRQGD